MKAGMARPDAPREVIDPRAGTAALVTRPAAEAVELAAALAMRDVAAVIEPLLDIRYRDDPPDLAGVQAVLCTSANGVRALARLVPDRGAPLFAVGAATAAMARAEGFADVHNADGAVGDLVRLVCARLRPGSGRLLHAAGSVAAGDLPGELRARGFSVERAVLYDARPATALGAGTIGALSARRVDVALFFSPRTAAIFARLAAQAGIGHEMRSVAAISISAAADAALGPLPFRARRIANRPDQSSMLAALDRDIEERRSA
jgi:uroporphyrinogen-III synthase